MKVLGYCSETFGIGTNPGGGIFVEIQPENLDEALILGHNSLETTNFFGEPRPVRKKIYRNLVVHHGNIPSGGGINPEWEKLKKYLGSCPIEWAKQHDIE